MPLVAYLIDARGGNPHGQAAAEDGIEDLARYVHGWRPAGEGGISAKKQMLGNL